MKYILWLSLLLTASYSCLAKDIMIRLEVIDPYLEMHTGPGDGYPIIYTVEQGEMIDLLTRRPDWYEIKSSTGRIGWVKSSQIARTIQPTGEPVDLPSVSYGDYLEDSLSLGFNVGQFTGGELKGSQTFSFTSEQRWLSWFGTELEVGKYYDSEVRGRYYGLNLLFEPYSDWVVSPVIIVGTGNMKTTVQPKLIPLSIEDSGYYQYGIGGNFYLGRNFVIRAGYREYTVSTEQDDERLDRWHIGFNAFF
ncbi:SH3 domain-containing protein [Aliikangiella coralliicola]|uniref:SH3 domain-containing protein n=1 Tax=Aliikangiella coralliicola TaxID=2592383 RepID=A0A545U046_9GAMM|nr:SH3 domain-containing protein [Aliikangiella coralliicola]TQV82803.1 SH3 domain-containing protein [Aliikangiella coralliicola]